MPDTWLKLDHVRVAYGQHRIIDELSLKLPRGSFGCLLGASGGGKSTLLRAIAGLMPVQSGSISLAGHTLSSATHTVLPEKRGIGFVFQDFALFPHLTVSENIGFGLFKTPRPEKEQRIAELLKQIGLSTYAKHYPHQLSGGQQQRVALARALAPRPQLLLLDEPFSSLDPILRKELAQELKTLFIHEHITALMVTHDQSEAFALADQMGVLIEGKMAQWDNAHHLYHTPRTREIANFIGEGAWIRGQRLESGCIVIPLGEICPHGRTSGKSEPVDVLLRPDDVVHDDKSSLQATVEAKSFHGAYFRTQLRLKEGSLVLSDIPSHHNHAIGETIGIRLADDFHGDTHIISFGI